MSGSVSWEIVLQVAVLIFTGLNAWTNTRTALMVSELRAQMYKEFITKADFDRHKRGDHDV